MSMLRIAVAMMSVAWAAPALAEVVISPTLVRAGFFQAPDCKPTADPKVFNECICEASIKKAEVKGLPTEVATLINGYLALLPEQLASESCEGAPTTPPTDGLKVNKASADYEIAYQTPEILTALIRYSTYGAGAEHPLEGTEGFTFDLSTGKVIDPLQNLKPEALVKADSFIKQELLRKYPSALYDEAKTRTDPYLSENGCDTCTLFYGKDGWTVRFQITAIAPYMTGEPEIIVPTSIIPAPETLTPKN
jgi:hypothetical protein